MKLDKLFRSIAVLLTAVVSGPIAWSQTAARPDRIPPVTTLSEAELAQLSWRSIGPANMGGRITSIAVYEADPSIWWAASASGGLVKTVNNGTTFEHQFDRQATVSIGDVQICQSDPNIVWVGTGESNPRNSVSWGDGVYKSVDGGKSWTPLGLKQSFQIGRIAIHPTDPNVVFVGALGRLWGPNDERGLYKTTDGGKEWKRVLYVDDKTGVIDVQIDPANPQNVLAATYERQRDGFDGNDPIKKYGPGAGVWRSTDGGETFVRVSQGLPTVNLGRIGLAFYRGDTNLVYAVVESEKIAKIPEDLAGLNVRTADAEVGAKVEQVAADSVAQKAGLQQGDIIVAVNKQIVHSDAEFWRQIRQFAAGQTVALEIARDRKPVSIEITLEKAAGENGGRGNVRNPFTGVLGGQAANLHDQQGPSGADYGGVYLSRDGGQSWTRINSLNPRPMYYSQIRVDPRDNQYLYILGTSLHRSKNGGAEITEDGGNGAHPDHHALWIDPRDPRHMILGNDGGIYVTYDRMESWDHLNHVAIGQFYHVGIDRRPDYWAYGGLQDNGSWGGPTRGGGGGAILNTDWIGVGGGDGFVCHVDPANPQIVYTESQGGAMVRYDLATGRTARIAPQPQRGVRYRFNWKTPFALSPHNSQIFYTAGNYVFRSISQGNRLAAISPEITNTDQGSGSALAVSPLEPGLIYVGTTDGAVWASRDDGQNWTPLFVKKETPQPAAEPPAGPRPASTRELAGLWRGQLDNDRVPEEQRSFELQLNVDDRDQITGTYTSPRGVSQVESGSYDPAEGKLQLAGKNERTTFTIAAQLDAAHALSGSITMGERFQMDFKATREPPAAAAAAESAAAPAAATPLDPSAWSGYWQVQPSDSSGSLDLKSLTLDAAGGSLSGSARIGEADVALAECQPDPKTESVVLYFGDDTHDAEASAKVRGRLMTINLDVDFGAEQTTLTARRVPREALGVAVPVDQLVGQYSGRIEAEMVPAAVANVTMTLKTHPVRGFAGALHSVQGIADIVRGSYDEASGKLELALVSDNNDLTFQGSVVGSVICGEVSVGQMSLPISLEKNPEDAAAEVAATDAARFDHPAEILSRTIWTSRSAKPATQEPATQEPAESDAAAAAAQEGEQAEQTPPQKGAAAAGAGDSPRRPGGRRRGRGGEGGPPSAPTSPAAQESAPQEPAASPTDPISGDWQGNLVGEFFQGERGRFEMRLKLEADGKLTGNVITERGDMALSGTWDAASGKVSLSGTSEETSVEYAGTLSGGILKGTATMGGGRFTVDFEARRADAAAVKTATGDPLEKLLPGPRWVSSLTASRHSASRVYATFDGHRSNDDTPYLMVSDDYGGHWRSLRANLPQEAGPVHALREDVASPDVLYLGCEFSAWVSLDRGQSWTRLSGLPTVAVHDFALHESVGHAVAATHGRSLWVADVSLLRQVTAERLAADQYLFQPNKVIRWQRGLSRGSSGTRRFAPSPPPVEAELFYYVSQSPQKIEIVIRNVEGSELRRLAGVTEKGLHRLTWDLVAGDPADPAAAARPGQGPGGGRGRAFRRGLGAGSYLAELVVDGLAVQRRVLTVENDPKVPEAATAADAEIEQLWEELGW